MRGERHSEWSNLAKRLANYKDQQKKRAEKKGVLDKLMTARTLTQARKVLRGEA